MEYLQTEAELKKRWEHPYVWDSKQTDIKDYETNFIYEINEYEKVLQKIETKFSGNAEYDSVFNYALNRWYNFWSANAVENIFKESSDVEAALDYRDKLVDFKLKGITFDHKTSIFPKNYYATYEYAKKHPTGLIEWLYQNQSRQRRMHYKNKLFIVLYDKEEEHWKLKAEIIQLKYLIEKYIKYFNPDNLLHITLGEINSKSDILWFDELSKHQIPVEVIQ